MRPGFKECEACRKEAEYRLRKDPYISIRNLEGNMETLLSYDAVYQLNTMCKTHCEDYYTTPTVIYE